MTGVSSPSWTDLACLATVARHHGVELDVDNIVHTYALTGGKVEAEQLVSIARDAGLRARVSRLAWRDLYRLQGAAPLMAQLHNGNWVIIVGASRDPLTRAERVHLFDPLAPTPEILTIEEAKFRARWSGKVLFAKKSHSVLDPDQPFGLLWFIPEIRRQGRLMLHVSVAAFLLYAFGLLTPMFFQLVVDRVLVHASFVTLNVLVIGVVVALLFEAAFNFLRRYLLLYATNSIDIRVTRRTFSHLLSLPIGFFERVSAGILVKHMQQAARVREFLTGRLFLTLLDGMSLFVFLPVLLLYSAKLTAVVIAFAMLVGVVIALLVKPFQRRLRDLYETEARRQALLVETVHGMSTVKALAIEPAQSRAWNDQSAAAVDLRFRVERISAAAQAMTGLLEKLSNVAIIAIGAYEVFSGVMTVGALVAFTMLSGRVSSALVQIVTLVHEYQEVALSVKMLGSVMNQPVERKAKFRGLRPKLDGRIDFEDVTFRYGPDGEPTLDKVSFTIPAGSIFGIVGRSGSGKTTVARLIQGLYPIQTGLVRIDGVDQREIDLDHVRRSMGVVLQDSFLFQGSVRDNIAIARRGATFEEIEAAARLAGATEFIERLPRGFDTQIEENGANLSGGQRQRLSIARALVRNPKILILDEATSALDPDTEVFIRQNMRRMATGRTVIIISHRLSSLVDCNAILVLERGKVSDIGRHDQLLAGCATYRLLWQQQRGTG
jgi:subfamily B ATP-binding cassette protein HlyB/CyaB